MKKDNETKPSHPVMDFFKGAALGSGVISAVTPLLYLKNMMQIKEKPNFRDCTRGILLNGASYVPTSVVAMTINGMLVSDDASNMAKVAAAFASGAFSGAVSCVPENIVQNKQAAKPALSVAEIVKRTVEQNGYRAFTRGSYAVMFREGLFAPSYLALVPILSQMMSAHYPKYPALNDLICSVVAGTAIGVITTPLDVMRPIKQKSLMKPGPAPSYAEIMRQVGWRGCWDGAKPRAAAVVAATFLMTQGRKMIANEPKEPEESSPQQKM